MKSPLRTDPSRIGPACPSAPGAADWPAPRALAWNVIRACSGPCAHCLAYSGDWPPVGGELSTVECLHVAEQITGWDVAPRLTLSGGDPLAREDLETIAVHLTRRGIPVVVATPGQRLSDRRAAALLAVGIECVEISLVSLDPSRHRKLSHSGASLEDCLAGADRCVAAGLPLVITTLVRADGLVDLQDIAAHAAELGARRLDVVFPPAGARLGAGSRSPSLHELSPTESDAALATLVEIEAELAGRVPLRIIGQPQALRVGLSSSAKSEASTRCECGLASCRISPEGKLTACPYIDEIFGDVRRELLLDAWRGSASLRRLREGERGGKCSWCEHREGCGGCRARAFTSQADILAADLSCSHEPGQVSEAPMQAAFSFPAAAPTPPPPTRPPPTPPTKRGHRRS